MSYLFLDKEFLKMWEIFKKYLFDDHKIKLSTQQEQSELSKLENLAGHDYRFAVEILQLAIINNEKSVIRKSDYQ